MVNLWNLQWVCIDAYRKFNSVYEDDFFKKIIGFGKYLNFKQKRNNIFFKYNCFIGFLNLKICLILNIKKMFDCVFFIDSR